MLATQPLPENLEAGSVTCNSVDTGPFIEARVVTSSGSANARLGICVEAVEDGVTDCGMV